MLKINDLSICYGELQVVWNVSFHVDKGEIVSVVGSNGAGKTTVLKAISGELKAASGEVEFSGERMNDLPPFKRVEKGISLVPEGRQLFPNMTVTENLILGAYAKKAYEKRNETLESVFQLFPRIKERSKQKAVKLSGGEQQMVAIGRALMARPKLLMLDEPSVGLAPKLVADVLEALQKLNEAGNPILLVEQNVNDALEIAHRGYVLETGRITLEGEAKRLLADKHLMSAYLGL